MEMAATAHLTAAAPDNEKFTVRSAPARLPRRKPNSEYRSREHRTEREVERLIEAAKGNRWVTAILQWCSWPLGTAYGYRIGGSSVGSRLTSNTRSCTSVESKNGSPATHPLTSKELRAVRRIQRGQVAKSPFVFISERGAPFSRRGFQAMVERAGKAAGFDVKIHPHMLRHACGFKLANDCVDTRTIQAYLGHKSIQHTVRYTELAPTRFKSLFRDWPRHVLDFKSKKGTVIFKL
jgi:integrase